MDFPGGVSIGSTSNLVQNVTFYGCRFSSNAVDMWDVVNFGDNITFNYDTFQPSAVTAPPTAYNKGYQYGIEERTSWYFPNNGGMTVDHSDFWGWGNAIEFHTSTQTKPLIVRNTYFHDARADGGIDHTDAILSNDGGPTYMVFDHNRIVSTGNTNGLALQYAGSAYNHVTVTNNYFSGFGYTVNIGGSGHLSNSTITGNTFGTDIQPGIGPLYGWGGTADTWRNNKYAYTPGTTWAPSSINGKYWWPDDGSSYTGHTTDYTG
jgi:hypothetical protein